jgi:rhamnosyltransferase
VSRRRIAPEPHNICAIVVSWNPSPSLENTLRAIVPQVAATIVVDNGSEPHALRLLRRLARSLRIRLLELGQNSGLGHALNRGIELAGREGYAWVLTLDQDSQPDEGMVEALCRSYRRNPERALAALAPQVIEAELGRPARYLKAWGPFFRRAQCGQEDIDGVTAVISSGMLLRLAVWEALGGFREDFFIDYVDTEFCLRARRAGFAIRVVCGAKLFHRLGARTKTRKGPLLLFPTHHPPERWYTISRNRIPMLRMYALRLPHWLAYELTATIYTLARMLLAEDSRLAKLKACLRGTADGLKNRMGKPGGFS